MYDKTVTVFNFDNSPDGAVWYPHVIPGADLNTDKGAILKKYGPDSTDRAELHIAFRRGADGAPVIADGLTGAPVAGAGGEHLIWLPPKAWAELEERENVLTLAPGDFFWWGTWDGGTVRDAEYTDRQTEGFYAHMARRYDYIYRITGVGGPYTVIPHFEILGA